MDSLRQAVAALHDDAAPPIAAHDIKHIFRVAALARKIAIGETVDPDQAETGALIHDLGRLYQTEEAGHADAGLPMKKQLLSEHTSYDNSAIKTIIAAASEHGLPEALTELGKVIQDADRLDGLGAIGLVRAYISKAHLLDYPTGVIVEHGSHNAQSISEQIAFQAQWYNMLNTATARKMGQRRIEFMRHFMQELKQDVEEASF